MTINTITIIKMLPLDEAFREDLLNRYDGMGDDEKAQVQRVLWDAYDMMVQDKLDAKAMTELNGVLDGKGMLDGKTYARAAETVAQETQAQAHEKASEGDLSSVRNRLQELTSTDQ